MKEHKVEKSFTDLNVSDVSHANTELELKRDIFEMY